MKKMARFILHEYKIHHAEVLFRCDATVDEFIDIVEGNRSYMRCIYVYNKVDQLSMEEVEEIAKKPDSIPVCLSLNLNLDNLVKMIWEYLALVRVYTKRRGAPPDFSDAIVLRHGCTVENVCRLVHKDLITQFKYSLVWGTSTKHTPQKTGVGHELEDEDVIQIVKK